MQHAMPTVGASVSPDAVAVTLGVGRRLLPFLVLCVFVAMLDRVDIGFAALHGNLAPGFTPTMSGLGAGIFFLGHILFGIPGSLALHRFGARRRIVRVMVEFGLFLFPGRRDGGVAPAPVGGAAA